MSRPVRATPYFIIDVDGIRMVFSSVSLCVFPHDISQIDAARITKRDVEMFHDDSWKPIYFGVKQLKVKVMATLLVWVFAFL